MRNTGSQNGQKALHTRVMQKAVRSWLAALAQDAGPPVLDTRLALVVRAEWTLLAVRYAAFFFLIGAHAVGISSEYLPNLLITTVGVGIRSAFVHWVLYTRRYRLFLGPINFVLYLAEVTCIVGITGAEKSPLVALYLLFIIGYCTFTPDFLNTFSVTLICCSAYAFAILTKWSFAGINPNYSPIALTFIAILLCGWLMSTLGKMVRAMRLEAQAKTQALASSEATMRTILDRAAEPIMVYGENEFISEVNDQACAFLGLRREKLIGRRFRSFLFDDGTLPNRLASLRARGEYHGEMIVITAGGDEHAVDLLVRSFIRDAQRHFVAMMHDITRQKDLHEASRLAKLKLEEINRELQQVNELRTAFVTTISQRLRSPLSAILGYTDLLLDEELGELSPAQHRALQSCRRSVLRVFNLVDEPFALGVPEPEAGTGPADGRDGAGEDTRDTVHHPPHAEAIHSTEPGAAPPGNTPH